MLIFLVCFFFFIYRVEEYEAQFDSNARRHYINDTQFGINIKQSKSFMSIKTKTSDTTDTSELGETGDTLPEPKQLDNINDNVNINIEIDKKDDYEENTSKDSSSILGSSNISIGSFIDSTKVSNQSNQSIEPNVN